MRSWCSGFLLFTMSYAAFAADPASPSPCTSPEYRQFDFWAGNWVVKTADGKITLGRNRIVPILSGCVLHEHWQGPNGFRGESFNNYDSESRRWYQNWVDQTGGSLRLEGGVHDHAMVLQGDRVMAGRRSLERITWSPLADGRVRQLWLTSTDGGKTWSVSFDGYYERLRS